MRFDRFDYLVWTILAFLGLTIAGVLWAENTAGARVQQTIPQDGEQAGAKTTIQIEFAEFMQSDTVVPLFSLDARGEPAIIGQFRWEGTTMIFSPDQPLTPGNTYTARLKAGSLSETGRAIQTDLTWQFQVRAPRIVYINGDREARDLWTLAPNESTPVRLTNTDGKLYDYAIAPNGEQIVYSVATQEGGVDLWIANEDGSSPRELVVCSPNRCTTPAWSPDSTLVAYSFERIGVQVGSPYSPPRVWTVNAASGQAAPLFSDEQVLGYGPSWSPDGNRLAFFDQGTGKVRVLNLRTNEEMALEASTGLPGSWSPDGQAMLYIGLLPDSGLEALFLADFNLLDVSVLFNSEELNGNFQAQPEWSPDGEWVVFNVKTVDTEVGNQFWIMPFDMSFGQIIASDFNYAYYNYQWDEWSRVLVYQRLKLGDSSAVPEIMVWTMDSWVSEVVVENGTNPEWLP
jgi:Tol biopolymer transport system component